MLSPAGFCLSPAPSQPHYPTLPIGNKAIHLGREFFKFTANPQKCASCCCCWPCLTLEETTRWSQSLSRAAFPDHDCVSLSHFVRLLRVNGKLHGLAGHCSWRHYLWPAQPQVRRQFGATRTDGQAIQQHFPALVQGLRIQEWPARASVSSSALPESNPGGWLPSFGTSK